MINSTCYAFLGRKTAVRKGLARAIAPAPRYTGPKALKVMFDYCSSGVWDAQTGAMVGLSTLAPWLDDSLLQALCAWHVEVESRAWKAQSQMQEEDSEDCNPEIEQRDIELEKRGFLVAQRLAHTLKCKVYYRCEITDIQCSELSGCWLIQSPAPLLFYRPSVTSAMESNRLARQAAQHEASQAEYARFCSLLDALYGQGGGA